MIISNNSQPDLERGQLHGLRIISRVEDNCLPVCWANFLFHWSLFFDSQGIVQSHIECSFQKGIIPCFTHLQLLNKL